ncbi:hypothetical protein R3P38DRAFT_3351161 [Favolaschia claudopus]|uniref:Uncharacterized protein n=1 Tax=Favolaschia claudopus TaxID=2862362 RepID=A0AAW0CBQ1_9AGAR
MEDGGIKAEEIAFRGRRKEMSKQRQDIMTCRLEGEFCAERKSGLRPDIGSNIDPSFAHRYRRGVKLVGGERGVGYLLGAEQQLEVDSADSARFVFAELSVMNSAFNSCPRRRDERLTKWSRFILNPMFLLPTLWRNPNQSRSNGRKKNLSGVDVIILQFTNLTQYSHYSFEFERGKMSDPSWGRQSVGFGGTYLRIVVEDRYSVTLRRTIKSWSTCKRERFTVVFTVLVLSGVGSPTLDPTQARAFEPDPDPTRARLQVGSWVGSEILCDPRPGSPTRVGTYKFQRMLTIESLLKKSFLRRGRHIGSISSRN